MARLRLTAAHYLNVPGVEWHQEETSQQTGERIRKSYPVPKHLDPNDPKHLTDRENGWIVVSTKFDPAHPRDVIFVGDPTPDMEPLDQEAEALIEARRPNWIHPIDSLPGQGFAESLIASFEKQIQALLANQPAKPVNLSAGVDPEAFAALQEQVAQLMARNAELEAKQPERRV
jgi:hypothetical protein